MSSKNNDNKYSEIVQNWLLDEPGWVLVPPYVLSELINFISEIPKLPFLLSSLAVST